MLHKFSAVGFSRSLASKHFRRLELEALEDRVSPALVIGGVPQGPYVAGGSFDATPGSSSIVIPQNSPLFEGGSSPYSMFSGGLDYTSDAYTLTIQGPASPTGVSPFSAGQTGATGSVSSAPAAASSVSPMQVLGQMEQLVGILSAMTVAQTHNPSQVFNLAVDEFFAAVDSVALAQAHSTGINTSAIQSDLVARQAAIQNNAIDHTPIGHQLGSAVYNTTVYMLAITHG